MKVSQLIRDIVQLAEEKFGVDDGHDNDCISIDVYYNTRNDMWQAGLYRPTQHQLDCGQFVGREAMETVKVWENTCGFYTAADTLVLALQDLLAKVNMADDCEFDPA